LSSGNFGRAGEVRDSQVQLS